MHTSDNIPLDSRTGQIWFDGEFVNWQDAKIHVLTHGLHYASSVFEGLRSYNGNIFQLDQHMERLINSANILGLTIPFSKSELSQSCNDILKLNCLKDAYIRPLAWSGSNELGVAAFTNKTHVAIACWEWPSYFSKEDQENGIRIMTSKWRRPSPECAPIQCKCASHYVIGTLAKHEAINKKFNDALMLDYRGLIAETTATNIFMIKDGQIHTPKPECALNGITRQTIIKIAKSKGLKVFERHIHPSELKDFSEVFLTGTAAEVTFVKQIDDTIFSPGQIGMSLQRTYIELTKSLVNS